MQGMSIACSTPEALKWDPEWAGTHEISGRAMKNVHAAGSEFNMKRCGLIFSLLCRTLCRTSLALCLMQCRPHNKPRCLISDSTHIREKLCMGRSQQKIRLTPDLLA